MYSPTRNGCSHPLGSPIRKSPDHRMFASPRGLSQLTTSFIACLCLGIPTYALSSLTIKSIHFHRCFLKLSVVSGQLSVTPTTSPPSSDNLYIARLPPYIVFTTASSNFCGCPSIFSFQRTLLPSMDSCPSRQAPSGN